jgi:regulatory protein
MDREAHGENFSSQKDNLEVTDIQRGAFGETVYFGFSDGSSFFIHPEAALEYGVRLGSEYSIDQLREILFRSAAFAARDKAVDYLARREHSASELILKLRKKDYDYETAANAVDMLIERGYVNDRRFARMWAESRLKKHPEGRSSLAAGLARKGVSRDTTNEVLDELLTEESQDEALSRCIEKYLRTRSSESRKLINHLLRRGFKYGDIKRQIAGLDAFNEENDMEFSDNEQ